MSRVTILALLALVGTLPVLYLTNGGGRQAIADCTSRGFAYFKEAMLPWNWTPQRPSIDVAAELDKPPRPLILIPN